MGWFPAREADGSVTIENLFFNQPMSIERAKAGGANIIKGRRASNGRGTPLNKMQNENKGPKKRHYTKLLAEAAMAVGYLNGNRLPRVKR